MAGTTPVLVHNTNCPTIDKSTAGKARAALRSSGWTPKSFDVGGGRSVLLSTERMVHIMTRHMPGFWDGSIKSTQTFFARSATIDDVTNYIGSTVRQNAGGIQDYLAGVKDDPQFEGSVDGNSFTLGMRRDGLIGQFFPH